MDALPPLNPAVGPVAAGDAKSAASAASAVNAPADGTGNPLFDALQASALAVKPLAPELQATPATKGDDDASKHDGADGASGAQPADPVLQLLAQADFAQAFAPAQLPAAAAAPAAADAGKAADAASARAAAAIPSAASGLAATGRDFTARNTPAEAADTKPRAQDGPPHDVIAAKPGARESVLDVLAPQDLSERTVKALADKHEHDPASALALAVQAQSASDAKPAAQPQPALHIDTPVGAPGWDKALGNQVLWMVDNDHHVAELHLNPPDLGPVQVVLTVNKDDTSAAFTSPHPVVRETIESALPRLKESLAEFGITLGQTSVSAQSSGSDSGAERETRQSRKRASADDASGLAPAAGVSGRARTVAVGLVDTFA